MIDSSKTLLNTQVSDFLWQNAFFWRLQLCIFSHFFLRLEGIIFHDLILRHWVCSHFTFIHFWLLRWFGLVFQQQNTLSRFTTRIIIGFHISYFAYFSSLVQLISLYIFHRFFRNMRILLSIFFLLFLSACSLPGTQQEWVSDGTTIVYQGSGFTTLVPKSWQQAENSTLPIPPRGSIVLAYMSKDVRYGFSSNYVIMMDNIDAIVTSKKYSELNHIQTTRNYLEYTKLEELPVTFKDSDTSLLYVFEARYNKTTPRMKFVQTAKTCWTKVYLLHATVSLDKTVDKYVDLLSSFECQ